MVKELYSLLGLKSEKAKASQVREAYRKLAKRHHPDAGGDPAVFLRLKIAHDLLLDPTRRAKYDLTGEIDEGKADNALAGLLETLSRTFMAAVTRTLQKGSEPAYEDMGQIMIEVLQEGISAMEKQVAEADKHTEMIKALQGKFSTAEGPNHMENILLGQLRQLETSSAPARKSLADCTLARDFMKRVRFKKRKNPSQDFQQTTININAQNWSRW